MAVTITRTPWIDDDGTGNTGTVVNNTIKTDLYNQIDEALAKVVPVAGGFSQWVPVDRSGVGLVFASATGHYLRVGSLCLVTMTVRWPATADATAPRISLPFPMTYFPNGGLYYVANEAATVNLALIQAGGDSVLLLSSTGTVTNATMSGKAVTLSGAYPVA